MQFSEDIKRKIKEGRSKFIAMAMTYSLGVFNDNYFKEAAMLLSAKTGKSSLPGVATIQFALPFILFSAYAGWLADRFAKRKVVIGTKILELAAMIIGAIGLFTTNWFCILAMVFLMAFQSTIFSPALNGSIPELYPEEYVSEANAFMKLVTTVAIIMGIFLAGISLDQNWVETEVKFGQILVAIVVLIIAGIGVLASFGVNKHKVERDHAPFPWAGPLNSIKDIHTVRKDPPLLLALIGSCFFYLISSLAVLLLNAYGISQFKYSMTLTSCLKGTLAIGICIGSFVAAKVSTNKTWTKMLYPSTLGIGVGFLLIATMPYISAMLQIYIFFIALIITGTFAGMLLIPIASFIQVRPAANEKGKILGAGNFLDFSGILFSGAVFIWIDKLQILPSYGFYILSIICLVSSYVFAKVVKKDKYKIV